MLKRRHSYGSVITFRGFASGENFPWVTIYDPFSAVEAIFFKLSEAASVCDRMTPLGLGLGLIKAEAFEANICVSGQTNQTLIQKRTKQDTNKKLKDGTIKYLCFKNLNLHFVRLPSEDVGLFCFQH